MSKWYRIELTPVEPYFFGSERTFAYGAEDRERIGKSDYFIRSQLLPSQTTLFGVTRYLGLQERTSGYGPLSDLDKKTVGEESFRYAPRKEQSFGQILRISQLYLSDGNGRLHVPIPLDHRVKESTHYCPFEMSPDSLNTSIGKSLFPKDGQYDAKEGISNSFLRIDDKFVVPKEEIFYSKEKTGINIERKTKQNTSSFFKEDYYSLRSGWAFVFFAKVEDGFPSIIEKVAYLGRGKSPFIVKVEDVNYTEPPVPDLPNCSVSGVSKIYLLSDSMLNEDNTKKLKEMLLFSITQFMTVREYTTNYGTASQKDRFKKSDVLYRLIRAGSVFLVQEALKDKVKDLFNDDHLAVAGLNQIQIR